MRSERLQAKDKIDYRSLSQIGVEENVSKDSNKIDRPNLNDKSGDCNKRTKWSSTKKGNNEKAFYGVAFGRKIGVFNNAWADTELLTKYFNNSRYKGFDTTNDAWKFVLNNNRIFFKDKLII